MTEKIGITLTADAEGIKKALDATNEKLEKTRKLLTQHGGKPKMEAEAQQVERGVRAAERAVKDLDRGYKDLLVSVSKMKRVMEDATRTGSSPSAAAVENLRRQQEALEMAREGRASARGQLSQLYAKTGIRSPQEIRQEAEKKTQEAAKAQEEGQARAAQRSIDEYAEWRRQKVADAGRSLVGRVMGFGQGLVNRVTGAGELLSTNMMARGQLAAAQGGYHKDIERMVPQFGMGYGFTRAESLQMALQTGRATGQTGAALNLDALSNMAMMRGYGMDAESLTAMQSAARNAGDRSRGHELNKELVKGMKLGDIPRILAPEMAQAISSLLHTAAQTQVAASTRVAMQTLGGVSRIMGSSFSQAPGRVASLVGGLHGAIATPGGGESGEALMLQAMGLGSDPSVDYFEAKKRMEAGTNDPKNIPRMMSFLQGRYSNKREQAFGLMRLSNGRISLAMAEKFIADYDPSAFGAEADDPNLGGEAAKVKGAYGLKAREIAKQEAAALARAKADPIFETADKVLIKVLQELAKLISDLIPYFKRAVDYLANLPLIGKFFSSSASKPGRNAITK